MELKEIFKQTTFSPESSSVHHILSQMTLITFSRTREGKQQTFHFTFTFNEKTYIMHHSFLFTWSSTKHFFRFSSPNFSSPPFKLTERKLELISNEFMKSVNEWGRIQSTRA